MTRHTTERLGQILAFKDWPDGQEPPHIEYVRELLELRSKVQQLEADLHHSRYYATEVAAERNTLQSQLRQAEHAAKGLARPRAAGVRFSTEQLMAMVGPAEGAIADEKLWPTVSTEVWLADEVLRLRAWQALVQSTGCAMYDAQPGTPGQFGAVVRHKSALGLVTLAGGTTVPRESMG